MSATDVFRTPILPHSFRTCRNRGVSETPYVCTTYRGMHNLHISASVLASLQTGTDGKPIGYAYGNHPEPFRKRAENDATLYAVVACKPGNTCFWHVLKTPKTAFLAF